MLYVGATCTAESAQIRTSLRAYVFAYPIGAAAFSPTLVLDFPLTYDRGPTNRDWQYWLNRISFNPDNFRGLNVRWAQPWLTDITFDRGDMILAFRDRNGDLFGIAGSGPDFNDDQNYTAVAQGDLLHACARPAGGWTLENNGLCGDITDSGHNNGQGPGGGEYYYQDFQDRPSHPHREETSWGSAGLSFRPRRRDGDCLRPG